MAVANIIGANLDEAEVEFVGLQLGQHHFSVVRLHHHLERVEQRCHSGRGSVRVHRVHMRQQRFQGVHNQGRRSRRRGSCSLRAFGTTSTKR